MKATTVAFAVWCTRRSVRIAAVPIILAVLALIPAGASATGWTPQLVATDSAWTTSRLNGVACSSPSLCFAVGAATSAGNQNALIERWDGTTWTIQTIGSPGRGSELYGVSCPSATFCMAVGAFAPSSGTAVEAPLALTWNGTAWTQRTAVLGATESGVFRAVSCTSAAFCETAGDTFTSSSSSNTLAERWNGARFTRQLTAGLPPAFFLGLSCASSTFCVADGGESPFPGLTIPFVESFNGSAWTPQSTTRTGQFLITPPGATNPSLAAASCPSASACQLVGSYTNPEGSISTPWAAGLSGGSWSREANPYVFADATFNAVSCATASDCWAVGRYTDFFGEALLLGEYWDGASWQLADIPTIGVFPELRAVACPTTDDCEAVGTAAPSSGQAIAEQYTVTLFHCCKGFAPHSFSLSAHGPARDGAKITAVLHKRRDLVLLVRVVRRHRAPAIVGLVPLGTHPAGQSTILWNLRVNQHQLPKGTYLITLHSVTGNVLSPATPPGDQTLIVAANQRVHVRS